MLTNSAVTDGRQLVMLEKMMKQQENAKEEASSAG
jgi:hypothetical protein